MRLPSCGSVDEKPFRKKKGLGSGRQGVESLSVICLMPREGDLD